MKAMTYEGKAGEHVSMSAQNAIDKARKYNRDVRMCFNGVTVKVKKRMSVRHVLRTWEDMIHASSRRYKASPAAITERERAAADIAAKQSILDDLIHSPPTSKADAITWLASYLPPSDRVGVNRYPDRVMEILTALGFISGQHVGDPSLIDDTASLMKRIEYVAGQVIRNLEMLGCVHPMVADWAEGIVREMDSVIAKKAN